jgi:hypothetical protein
MLHYKTLSVKSFSNYSLLINPNSQFQRDLPECLIKIINISFLIVQTPGGVVF